VIVAPTIPTTPVLFTVSWNVEALAIVTVESTVPMGTILSQATMMIVSITQTICPTDPRRLTTVYVITTSISTILTMPAVYQTDSDERSHVLSKNNFVPVGQEQNKVIQRVLGQPEELEMTGKEYKAWAMTFY
jgi:hypothetical protein